MKRPAKNQMNLSNQMEPSYSRMKRRNKKKQNTRTSQK